MKTLLNIKRSGACAFFLILCFFGMKKNKCDFKTLRNEFISEVKKINLPPLQLSYQDNIDISLSLQNLNAQLSFFTKTLDCLSSLEYDNLIESQKEDYDIIKYQSTLNIEKLLLLRSWDSLHISVISSEGLYQLEFGKKWYRYFLKRWLDDDVSPEAIFNFGMAEVQRAQENIKVMRLRSGLSEKAFYNRLNNSTFFESNSDSVYKAFSDVKKTVASNLNLLFFDYKIDSLKIAEGRLVELKQTPGYYSNDTFFFNQFGKPYCKRQYGWLFMHEGIPGHHFQRQISLQQNPNDLEDLFHYNGYTEGWAAYIEEYGRELKAYRTDDDEIGKWEWDIVRSVRVPLDVGINYFGWTDDQAFAFWRKHVTNQDGIAKREIARVKRWPCQAITYKYGAAQFLAWREKAKLQFGTSFQIKVYHDIILKNSHLPFPLLQKKIFRQLDQPQ